jgi:hypothetical protein
MDFQTWYVDDFWMTVGANVPWKEPIPKIRKKIFSEKGYQGHCPNFYIHVSVSDLYIPTIDPPILLQKICGLIMGIYKSLTDT